MNAWSGSPFAPVTPLAEVRGRGTVISAANGESELVYESAGQPGWLVKLYKPGFPREPVDVLDRLIALPSSMPTADLAVVDSSICWPVTRVVDGSRTVGVVLAKAPAAFTVPMRMISGIAKPRILDIDQIVQTDPDFFNRRGWDPPTTAERLAVARGLAAAGALLERYGVVYGDWSYANAFWARGNGRVFVIDMDSCGIADRPWVESKSWDDPRVEPGARLTTLTDRYKLAVLVLRSMTGLRGMDFRAVHAALPAEIRRGPLGEALWTALTTADPEQRPTMAELHGLLDSACEHPPPKAALPSVTGTNSSSTTRRQTAPRPATTPIPSKMPQKPRADPDRLASDRLLLVIISICVTALALFAVVGLVASLFS